MSTNRIVIPGQTHLAVHGDTDGVVHTDRGISGPQTPQDVVDGPLPRPERRPRRAKADRGLPPDEELAKLAAVYLDRQRKHWPDMAEAGALPVPNERIRRLMVEDFKERHRTGKVDLDAVLAFRRFCGKVGGGYQRYSCDNSSPTSILDQVVNILDKARANDCFIPWQYLFADYSISGLDASRQGYRSYKSVLDDEDHKIQVTFVDDFTRASRDELEWWRLAALSKRLGKGMIGASDGFDLSNANSDILITVFGLVSRLFIKGLKEKVRRGMKGAARRGTCLGKLSLGFTRQVCRDANGQVICRPDGRPRHKPCIDPATQPYRVEMFEMFVHKRWSLNKIAKHFNQLRVDGSNGWTRSSIRNLLAGIDAIGIFVWNRYRREYDYEQEKYVTIENPRSEWEIYKDPSLSLVPKELWRAAWLKLCRTRKAHPLTGKKWSRNQKSATTLFSGTLFCEYCNTELRLNRSAGKYKVMSCLSGSTGVHDCPLTTSKSTQIIEDCLLSYIRDSLLTEETIVGLVEKANAFLEHEARRPRVDTASTKAKLRDCSARIKKLVRKVEREPDEALCDAYDVRIKELQKEANELKAAIREAEAHNRAPPEPLDVERAKVYLADLRGLLNQEIPMAAEATHTLTGPIKIRQEKVSGRPGARWIATFSPDVAALLRQVARDKQYLDSKSLDAAPTEAQTVEVAIEKVPRYELWAPLFKQMEENGASIQTIASTYKICWQDAKAILDFAKTGRRPKWRSGKGDGTGQVQATKYLEIQEEVSHLRDVKKMPFRTIAAQLGVGAGTVRRAYDSTHQDTVCDAAERGKTPDRGRSSILGEEKHQMIREMLRNGKKDKEIAAKVGCGTSTVGRVRRQMQAAAGEDQAA